MHAPVGEYAAQSSMQASIDGAKVRPASLPSMLALQEITKEDSLEVDVLYVEPSMFGQSSGRMPVAGTGVAPTTALLVLDAVEEAELEVAGEVGEPVADAEELELVATPVAELVAVDDKEELDEDVSKDNPQKMRKIALVRKMILE
jgi:hypothetical protein